MFTFLSGGTGTPKLLEGFRKEIPDSEMHIICNMADDFEYLSCYISPDFDTVLYLFAGLLDTKKFWGRDEETFTTLSALKELKQETWFQLGDKDIALHLVRRHLLDQGFTFSEIASKLCALLGVQAHLYPMSNERVTTRVTSNGENLHFQEFWVKYRGKIPIDEVNFVGHEKAKATKEAIWSLKKAEGIIIGPSNPVTSILPILLLPPYRETIKDNASKLTIFSPIVGDTAISGPAPQLMRNKGIKVSAKGIANYYKDFAHGATFVLDNQDEKYKESIKSMGYRVMLTQTVMKSWKDAREMSKLVLTSNQ